MKLYGIMVGLAFVAGFCTFLSGYGYRMARAAQREAA